MASVPRSVTIAGYPLTPVKEPRRPRVITRLIRNGRVKAHGQYYAPSRPLLDHFNGIRAVFITHWEYAYPYGTPPDHIQLWGAANELAAGSGRSMFADGEGVLQWMTWGLIRPTDEADSSRGSREGSI